MGIQAGDTRLQRIQALQFSDKASAESLLLAFVRETFPDLDVNAAELRPLAVSLNSFNGFLTLSDGSQLFYKTHVEPGSVIDEYYNATLLSQAGYPVILPRYASTEYGRQFLIYDVIDWPSLFDVMQEMEAGQRHDMPKVAAAQYKADDQLLTIYLRTLEKQSSEDASQAAIHQLFHHRLDARYAAFYADQMIALPGIHLAWDDLCKRQWEINGAHYSRTLAEAITQARIVLRPQRAGPSIVGHGDAHNGNVFYSPKGMVYFDPAFGGRHHPLLDLAKPLFHNVFATWMYHPEEVAETCWMRATDDGHTIHVAHDHTPSGSRRVFFASKMERVLKPLVGELRRQDQLPADWREYLKLALMCCPLLTMNLTDSQRFPPLDAMLGLCYAVEMGLHSDGGELNLLNRVLNNIEG
ncbi:MAG TPA: hypothetical protein VKQ72_22285 [Aggregatilineales bacterium]|nr:hypothetical protein [Aggregatilineales bacterium]